MDRGNTKQEILEAALELFSVQGFEATSISQIASAVGIRKASLYSHFESKQAILDALVRDVLDQYAAHSIFARPDGDSEDAPTPEATTQPMTTAGGMDNAGTMTPAEAGRTAERISDAVERISEISDAEVVVSGPCVLVAVEFEDQSNAGLDERMKQTITETVKKTYDGAEDVEITDDDTLYGQVKGLGERLAKATGLDELADDFGDLWDRIVGRT